MTGTVTTGILAGCSGSSQNGSPQNGDKKTLPEWGTVVPKSAIDETVRISHIDVDEARSELSDSQFSSLIGIGFPGIPVENIASIVYLIPDQRGSEISAVLDGDFDTEDVKRDIKDSLDGQSASEEYDGYTVYTEATPEIAVNSDRVVLSQSPREYIDIATTDANGLNETNAGAVLTPISSRVVSGAVPQSQINRNSNDAMLDPKPLHGGFTGSPTDSGGRYDIAYLFESGDQAISALDSQEDQLAESIVDGEVLSVEANTTDELVLMTVEVDRFIS